MCALNARTLPSGRPGGRGRWIGRGSSVDGVVACPPRRARSPRVHGSNAPRTVRCETGDTNMTKSRFGAPSHMRVLRVATRLQPQRRLDTMLLRLHLLGTIRNKATNGACPHANVRGPYVRLPCTLPMPAARMRPCPIWPHAIQRNWIPSAPEMGQIPDVEPRFPPCT